MWAAEQILRLKEQPGYEDIELVVALPFVGHDAKWDQRSKRRMEFILQHCSKKEVIGNEDCRESYVKRNCYMVDQANYLVAVYDDVRNLRSGYNAVCQICAEERCSGSSDSPRHSQYNLSDGIHQERRV